MLCSQHQIDNVKRYFTKFLIYLVIFKVNWKTQAIYFIRNIVMKKTENI